MHSQYAPYDISGTKMSVLTGNVTQRFLRYATRE